MNNSKQVKDLQIKQTHKKMLQKMNDWSFGGEGLIF